MRCRFAVIAAFAVAGLLGLPAIAQAPSRFDSADEARAALDAARQQQRNARARSERLEREAASSRETSAKARADAAALAARVQQAEASIAAAEARLALTNRERRLLDRRLSARRAPLVRLTLSLILIFDQVKSRIVSYSADLLKITIIHHVLHSLSKAMQ